MGVMLRLPGDKKKWWWGSWTNKANLAAFLFGCGFPGLSDEVRTIVITSALANMGLRAKTQRKIR